MADADGKPPTIPFWTGEAPARTPELSEEISALRSAVDTFVTAGDPDGARAWLAESARLDEASATQVVDYIAAGKAVLGVVPTGTDLVFERFFDDADGMHLVVHSPLGGRINRALGLALRKRFCVSFDFELQAAANDDAVVLSLGPHHSFPLADVPRFLNSRTVREVLRAGGAVAAVADVHQPLAVEPQPGPDRVAVQGRPAQPAAAAADGGRRLHGRAVPPGGRLPGERRRPGRRSPTIRSSARRCTTR